VRDDFPTPEDWYQRTAARVPLTRELAVDVPVTWTGSCGHLVQEPWTPPWIRDGLAALISELEAAAPPGLGGIRTTLRQQGATQRDNAISRLLDQRVELVIAAKLVRAGVLARISRQTPDFECRGQGSEFGIEVTTRARREVGSELHDLLEEGLFEEPDIEVILERSDDRLLFSEDRAKTAPVADCVITAIKERVAAAAGQSVSGRILIPEFGFTAVLHHVVSRPGMRVTFEPPLTDEQWEHHWKMAALQIKDRIEKKGSKPYALPSIVVLDVSRLGAAGKVPADASWMGKFQDVLDGCELGNLSGAVVMRSKLVSELLHPLCWRGDDQLVAAAMTPLFGGLPKAM
jgi:hypothetical protein